MKRSDALAGLSRDHHRGLVVAQCLTPATEATADRARQAFLEWWERERRHFGIEEEVLLPALARHVPADHESVVRVLTEHVDLRRRAGDVAAAPTAAGALQELGARLLGHIRYEERTLFSLVETALPDDELAELGVALDRAHGSRA